MLFHEKIDKRGGPKVSKRAGAPSRQWREETARKASEPQSPAEPGDNGELRGSESPLVAPQGETPA